MNPTVEAALISGGWASAVAGLGYAYNRATAKATIKATNANALVALDAAHQAQVWEQKSAAYVDALSSIHRRQAARQHLISPLRYNETTEKRMTESFTDPADWDWAMSSARLTAYASQPVMDAMQATIGADKDVRFKQMQWHSLTVRATSPAPGAPDSDQIMAAFEAIQHAAQAAIEADSKLETAIRADLHLKPSERILPEQPGLGHHSIGT